MRPRDVLAGGPGIALTEPLAYEFGGIRVDTRRLAVTREGQPVPLEPKTFDVLRFLIDHRDRVVTKEELLDAVWKDTFVTPNVLTRAIAQLRKALGDDAFDARLIETLAKRGYRFIADVSIETVPASSTGPEPLAPTPLSALELRLPAAARLQSRHVIAIAVATALIAVAAATWMARRQAEAPTPPSTRRLTTRSGYDGMPAISPDGRSVAYVSDRTGSLELEVSGLAPGSREIAITNDGGQNMQPEWSPDGQWLAFFSAKRGGVWIVPSSGGVPQQIVEFGSDPSWSPDGQQLVFTSDAGGMVSQSSLWMVRRDGSDRRQLTKLGEPAGGHRQPIFSGDGRLVAFTVGTGSGTSALWLVTVADGHLTDLGVAKVLADPRFGPRDDFVYWAGLTDQSNAAVMRIPLDRTGQRRGDIEILLPITGGALEGLSIARNGSAVFALAASDHNLWAVDVGPNGASPPVRLTDDAVRNTHPSYSWDGRIAYLQIVTGQHATVAWVMNEDGTGREPIMPDMAALDPQWTRDGRLFVLRPPDIFWVDPVTRRATPAAVRMGDMLDVRLSADGRELAYHKIQAGGIINVWTRPVTGGPERQITFDNEAATYPRWSPDGRMLAVELKRGDSTQIAVVPSTGGAVRPLVTDHGQSWPHSWSPDNDHLAFAGQRDGVWNIWQVSSRTGVSTPLTHFTSASGYVRYPAWSPRGGRIVFERRVGIASVWMVKLQ